jgi:cytidylate kinase
MNKVMNKFNNLKYRNITISSLPGAGSTTLSKKLARFLNWEYWSGGDYMRNYAIKKDLFDKSNKLHHDATVYADEFDRQVDNGMRESLRKDSGRVLDSWLSGFMAQGIPGILKVLVYCSDDAVRVDRVTNRDGVDIQKAKEHIFEREEKNLKKWQRMYGQEWQKWVVKTGKLAKSESIFFWRPELYDLSIDTYSHSKQQTLQLVLRALGVRT